MKKLFTAALIVAITMLSAVAQPPQDGDKGPGGPGGPRPSMDPAKMVERLDKSLSLSDEQKTQLTKIYTEQVAEMKKMHESMEEGERPDMEQMNAMRQKQDSTVKSVLTDEQKTKYDELKKQQMKHRGPGGPGGPGGGKPEDVPEE